MRKGKFNRWVGIVIVATTACAAGLIWIIIAIGDLTIADEPSQSMVMGMWRVIYNTQAPSPGVVLVAAVTALLAAAGVTLGERHFASRSYRSENRLATPLAPKIVAPASEGAGSKPVTITVLIPAHNEAASLAATIESVLAQSYRPDRVVVVADNCTDATVDIARQAGVDVLESVGNTKKKAGALNQALARLLPEQGENDLVMVMDADTMLDEGFLKSAALRFTRSPALMALGGLFYGEHGHGLLGQFQRNEYVRYSREMQRRRGRVFVLTGTASMFRPRALRTVAESRGELLPGTHGDVYDTAALTEDNELTIALKTLGALMVSPSECTVVTELMPTWRTLWAQRLRWQRGALENIGAYGFTRQTMRYWAQQLGIGYGVIALSSYFLVLSVMFVSLDAWIWFPFWVGLGVLFSAERVITVWKGGWRARLLAMTVIPELVFDLFLDAVYIVGIAHIALDRKAQWKHLTPTAQRK